MIGLHYSIVTGILLGMKKEQRLSKVLASAGVASRRACEELIFSGKVTVNGQIIVVPQTHVLLGRDKISVDGKDVIEEEKKVYFILNKPTGYICTNKRPGSKKIVLDLFEPLQHKLFTIGRLDRETSGLLLVTNDGHFANKVIHPSSNISKELFNTPEEENLLKCVSQIELDVDKQFLAENYEGFFDLLASLSEPLSCFFDRVMVNDKNEEIKNNRLQLLLKIRILFDKYADFSEIQLG